MGETIKYSITIKSPLVTGSGTQGSGDIDLECVFDAHGLPYIPGKRLKGLLRDTFYDYITLNKLKHTLVDMAFGEPGSATPLITVSSARLADADLFGQWLSTNNQYIFSPEMVRSAFSLKVKRTAIDRKTGIAKKGSLRVFRCLRPGLSFDFEIELLSNDNDLEFQKAAIEAACSRLTSMGYGRRRGLGEIEVKKVEPGEQQEDKKNTDSPVSARPDSTNNDANSLQVDIELLEPVSVRVFADSGQHETADFIPGSTLLGALAGEWMRKNPKDSPFGNNPDFRALFVDGASRFHDGYPLDTNDTSWHETIPLPASFAVKKNQASEGNVIYDLSQYKSKTDGTLQSADLVRYSERYIRLCGDSAYSCSTPLGDSVHFRAPDDKRKRSPGEKGEAGAGVLFDMQYIRKGQCFRMIIDCNGLKDKTKSFDFLLKDSVIRIGKSKTAGYAAAKILKVTPVKITNIEITAESSIMLTQPLAIRNPVTGIFDTTIECLTDCLESHNLELMKDQTFLKRELIGGYSSFLRLPKPPVAAWGRGSVLRVKPIAPANNCAVPFDCIKLDKEQYTISEYKQNNGPGDISIIRELPIWNNFSASMQNQLRKTISRRIISHIYQRNLSCVLSGSCINALIPMLSKTDTTAYPPKFPKPSLILDAFEPEENKISLSELFTYAITERTIPAVWKDWLSKISNRDSAPGIHRLLGFLKYVTQNQEDEAVILVAAEMEKEIVRGLLIEWKRAGRKPVKATEENNRGNN